MQIKVNLPDSLRRGGGYILYLAQPYKKWTDRAELEMANELLLHIPDIKDEEEMVEYSRRLFRLFKENEKEV